MELLFIFSYLLIIGNEIFAKLEGDAPELEQNDRENAADTEIRQNWPVNLNLEKKHRQRRVGGRSSLSPFPSQSAPLWSPSAPFLPPSTPFPPSSAPFPSRWGTFPPTSAPFPSRWRTFPPTSAPFPSRWGTFPPSSAPFPSRWGTFPPTSAPPRQIERGAPGFEDIEQLKGLRLIDSNGYPNRRGGRVEVFMHGQWGTVCKKRTHAYATARVICRQLNQGTPYNAFPYQKIIRGFGWFTKAWKNVPFPIWLHEVKCFGTEKNLFQCKSNSRMHDCSHSEDLIVGCDGYVPDGSKRCRGACQ